MKTRLALFALLFLAFNNLAFAQQTTEPPVWEVTLPTGTTARSTLTVVNRCKKSHEFQIVLENVPFLKFAGVNQVKVSGGKSVEVPVVFDTNGIAPGLHTGLVTVLCQTCKSEPTCTQDRERLPVKLTVTGSPTTPPSTGTTTSPTTTQTPSTTSPTVTTPTATTSTTEKKKGPCEEAEQKCEELRLRAWQLESQAATARAIAQQARQKANELEAAATAAEQKARDLTNASKDSEQELERLTDTERGRVYTGADFRKRREYENGIWADFRAGKITSEQAYQKLQEFHGPDGIDKFQDAERKRLSELKYQAEEATKAAEMARAAANAAAAQAASAEAAARRAEEEAAKARTAYEDCLKQIPSDCPKPGTSIGGTRPTTGGPQTTDAGGGPKDQSGGGLGTTDDGKDPCEDCDEELRALHDKEAEAAKAQALADEARKQAEGPEKAARDAEEAAKKAADAAKDPTSRGRIIDHERGRVYTSRDFELQREANRAAWGDYKSGKINAQQLEQQWKDNDGLDALDRLQDADQKDRAKKKFEAEQLAKKAAEARAAADAANAIARAAQEAANRAKAEAEAVRKAYEECLKKLKEECEKARAAAAKAEAERQAAAAAADRATAQAAANAQAAADLKRRQEAEAARQAQLAQERAEQARIAREQAAQTARNHRQYLIDNIRQLNLIPYKGWTDVPGIWDWLPKYLEKPVGDLAEEAGRVPIPTDVLKAIGGLYNIVNILLDPCTGLGARKTVERLENMTNPKTNRKYTLNEALTKTEQMCALLRQLKAKVEAENRANR